jgi:hypothetical protein
MEEQPARTAVKGHTDSDIIIANSLRHPPVSFTEAMVSPFAHSIAQFWIQMDQQNTFNDDKMNRHAKKE